MTVSATETGVTAASAAEAVRAKDDEIDRASEALRELRARRERVAVAGGDTRPLRGEIADAEADLDEMRMQANALAQVLDELRAGDLHRERLAALAGVYRRDIEYLKARRLYLVKVSEMEAAQAAINDLVGSGMPYHMVRTQGGYLARLGVACAPDAAMPVAPLSEGAGVYAGGATTQEVDETIAHIDRLAQEAEDEARCDDGSSSGNATQGESNYV